MNDTRDRGIVLLQDLSTALARLTRIPVPGIEALPPSSDGSRVLWAYPVIGTLIGASGGIAYGVLYAVGLPALLAAVAAVGCQLALTGVVPENSFVRCVERFAGRDSLAGAAGSGPLGTVGIIVLVLALAIRVGALAALVAPVAVAGALVAAGALSQAVVAVAMHFAPTLSGGDAEFGEFDDDDRDARPSSAAMLTAALLAVVVAALVLPFGAAGAILAAAAAGAAVAGYAWRVLGGTTPDLNRAAQQAAEMAVLVVVAAVGGSAP